MNDCGTRRVCWVIAAEARDAGVRRRGKIESKPIEGAGRVLAAACRSARAADVAVKSGLGGGSDHKIGAQVVRGTIEGAHKLDDIAHQFDLAILRVLDLDATLKSLAAYGQNAQVVRRIEKVGAEQNPRFVVEAWLDRRTGTDR